jgi:hypothetical protein
MLKRFQEPTELEKNETAVIHLVETGEPHDSRVMSLAASGSSILLKGATDAFAIVLRPRSNSRPLRQGVQEPSAMLTRNWKNTTDCVTVAIFFKKWRCLQIHVYLNVCIWGKVC